MTNEWPHWSELSARPPRPCYWTKWGGFASQTIWRGQPGSTRKPSLWAVWRNSRSGVQNVTKLPGQRTRPWLPKWRKKFYEPDSIIGSGFKPSGHQGPAQSLQNDSATFVAQVRLRETIGSAGCSFGTGCPANADSDPQSNARPSRTTRRKDSNACC